jgi:hypothetical protein
VANLEWRNFYSDPEVEVGTVVHLDHASLILKVLGDLGIARHRRRFHFEASWFLEEGCKEVLQNS